MKLSRYRKNNGEWFRGKKAKINLTIRNRGGDIIYAGEIVTISGKSGRGGFNLTSESRVSISCVEFEKVDLIEE